MCSKNKIESIIGKLKYTYSTKLELIKSGGLSYEKVGQTQCKV